jgi:hypothetical protein
MAPEERGARIQFLEGLGVPQAYHDAIIDAPTTRMMRWGGPALALGLVAMIVIVMAATLFWLTNYVEARAAETAAQTGATLTSADVGIGPILLLFGLLALMGWASWVAARQHKVQGFRSSAATMLNPHPNQKGSTKQFMKWVMRGSVKHAAAQSSDIDGFLYAVANHQARRWALAAFVLLVPAVTFTVLETNSYWVAGPSGVVEHRMFPPFSHQHHELKDVKRIVTGCNNTDKANRLIYDIHFASGDSFSLGYAEPAKSGDPRPIEAVDTVLPRGIAHQRWSHLNRNPVHPACLKYWAALMGPDGVRRLTGLLRLKPTDVREVFVR